MRSLPIAVAMILIGLLCSLPGISPFATDVVCEICYRVFAGHCACELWIDRRAVGVS